MLLFVVLACSDTEKESFLGDDESPTVTLTTPDMAYLTLGLEIYGTVQDDVDLPSELSIVLTSNIDGELNISGPDSEGNLSYEGDLSSGDHTLTLQVSDTGGNVAEAVQPLTVFAENTPPSCSIQISEESWLEGETIVLQGQVDDPNVPIELLSIEWSSDFDGTLGAGEIDSTGAIGIQLDQMSWNEHLVTLVVTDELGATCEQSTFVRVGHVPNIGYCQNVLDWSEEWKSFEADVVDLTNEIRQLGTTCGGDYYPPVQPLVMQRNLRCSSRVHSKDMMDRDYFAHNNLDGESPGDRITQAEYSWMNCGENIAFGYATPEAVVDAWQQSPGHCRNLMSASFDEIGVGMFDGGTGIYWTQNFGTQ